MNLIVAVTKNWGIGINGGLLLSIPEDMKYFREKTVGKTVLMGQTTLESFPGGKPLKNRTNIVLSDDPDFSPDGAVIVRSLQDALRELKKYPDDDIFVIGGASVYKLMLPYCRYAYITKMDISPEADRFIPDLDADPDWSVDIPGEEMHFEDVSYRFMRYVNAHVKKF